jgi:FkbM family methyltransferase
MPEFIKSRIRGRFYGYRKSHAKLGFEIQRDEIGPVISIDGSIRFRITDEEQEDFSFHLVRNGASVEELVGFIEAAKSARALFDVGAHKGLFSLVFCAVNENNRAVAYEPSPSLGEGAKNLIEINGWESRIDLQSVAIGASRSAVAASFDSMGFLQLGGQEFQIQMTSIDEECERLKFYPDVLKIDIEGYEYEALLGATGLLKSASPIICLELHLDMLERRGIKPRLITDQLTSNNYRFFSCLGQPLEPRDVYGSADAVLRFIARKSCAL